MRPNGITKNSYVMDGPGEEIDRDPGGGLGRNASLPRQ